MLHRVSYADCTVGNHIYYGRYLELLEMARGEFFRHLGNSFLQWQHDDAIFPVIESHLRYKAPARYDDLLQIELWMVELAGIRLSFEYEIRRDQTVILHGTTRHICTSLVDKPKRVPELLLHQLQPYLRPGEVGTLKKGGSATFL